MRIVIFAQFDQWWGQWKEGLHLNSLNINIEI